MATTLKFPVLKKVEYIDIIKNRSNVLSLTGEDVEGLTWRKFQLLLGSKLPDGSYNYVIKIKNDPTIHKGLVRTAGKVTTMAKEQKEINPDVQKQILDLTNQVDKMGSGNGVSVDLLIQVTRQSFETQVTFLNHELTRKDLANVKLENKIDDLLKELEGTDVLISELKEKTGMTQYITIVKEFLSMKAGNIKPITNLSASETSDVPPEIIQILGVVDWQKVPGDVLIKITSTMKIFIQELPLKEG